MALIERIEPFLWAMFGAGGMLAALLVPAHILMVGLLIPIGSVPPEAYAPFRLDNLYSNPLFRLYLWLLLAATVYHAAHRFRFALFDLGIRGARFGVALLCYGAALVVMVWGAAVLLSV